LYVVVVPKSWFFVHRRCTCLRFNIEPQNGHDLCHNVRKSFSKLQTTSLFFRIRCGGDFPWIIGISWDIRYNPEKNFSLAARLARIRFHRRALGICRIAWLPPKATRLP
jgi:hypothetical protein